MDKSLRKIKDLMVKHRKNLGAPGGKCHLASYYLFMDIMRSGIEHEGVLFAINDSHMFLVLGGDTILDITADQFEGWFDKVTIIPIAKASKYYWWDIEYTTPIIKDAARASHKYWG